MKTSLLFAILGVSLANTTFAGEGGVGNGGGIHYCPGRTYQEFYDIYEGRLRYQININNDSNLTVEEYIANGLYKISTSNPTLAFLVKKEVKYMKDEGHFILAPGIHLAEVPDAHILFTNEGCRYEQLANWDDVTGNIFVRKEYFDLLSTKDQAALYLHEALYKVGRDRLRLEYSDKVRRIVAEVMSENAPLTQLEEWRISSDVHVGSSDAVDINSKITYGGHATYLEITSILGSLDYDTAEDLKTVIKFESHGITEFFKKNEDNLKVLHGLQETIQYSCSDYYSYRQCKKDKKRYEQFIKVHGKALEEFDKHFSPSVPEVSFKHNVDLLKFDLIGRPYLDELVKRFPQFDFDYKLTISIVLADEVLKEKVLTGRLVDLLRHELGLYVTGKYSQNPVKE